MESSKVVEPAPTLARLTSSPLPRSYVRILHCQCFCGLPTDDPYILGAATNCDKACVGDTTEICGGNEAISLYTLPAAVATTSVFLGCYNDVKEGRIMEGKVSASSMTNEVRS